MNSRVFPALVIMFIIAAGTIIFIDMKSVAPKQISEMPDVKEVIMPENSEGTADIDVYFYTKETIKKRGRAEEKLVFNNNFFTEQNPFLLPEETHLLKIGKENFSDQELVDIENKIQGVDKTDTVKPLPRFHLSMIMVGNNQKFALVNQEFVSEGDHVEDFKVEKISKKSIVLINKDGKREILLKPDSVPLIHKSSDVQAVINPGQESKTTEEDNQGSKAGDLRKQLKDVLKMYDNGLEPEY